MQDAMALLQGKTALRARGFSVDHLCWRCWEVGCAGQLCCCFHSSLFQVFTGRHHQACVRLVLPC